MNKQLHMHIFMRNLKITNQVTKHLNMMTRWIQMFPLNLGKFFLRSYDMVFGKSWMPSKSNGKCLLVEIDLHFFINGLHTRWRKNFFLAKLYFTKISFRIYKFSSTKSISNILLHVNIFTILSFIEYAEMH